MSPIGIYLHVPFCLRKCSYCDFYSLPYREETVAGYVDALCTELQSYAGRGLRADTLYFGGGTPSLLPDGLLERILQTVDQVFGSAREVTLEANPGTLSPDRLVQLRGLGINRLSVGVQSVHDGELSALSRLHNGRTALSLLEAAHRAGFSHLSADLMLGTPGQTMASLQASVEALAESPIDHLSAYLLKVEPGTPLATSPLRAECMPEETVTHCYLQTVEQLESLGFAQYEISNFARPGGESRHNLKYWRCKDYLGFGPAAHSFFEGRRFCHTPSLPDYLADPIKTVETDGLAGGPDEKLMLRLRLTRGVPLRWLETVADRAEVARLIRRLEPAGLLRQTAGRVALTPRGMLLSNEIITEFLMLLH